MSHIYDNWERLVRATLRREQFRLIAERSPSDLSLSSSSASPLRVSSSELPSLLIGEAFDYDQILRASNYFSNSNLIRHGRSGDLFYGVLDDGTQVIVKKFHLSSVIKESYYVSELEAFNNASHSRLVPLIGHCLDNLNDKFLVYKYMTNRDLSSSFFRQVDSDDEYSLPSLDWITRLKIATGAAEALCYLHNKCFPPLVHRDVQASSILLDDDYEVRLGSLTDVCAQNKENGSNQNRITGFPQGSKQGTSGPGQSNAYCAYDVYCFGKVLLELVTGKLGFSAAIAEDFTMNDWMEKILPYINITEKELIVQIIDPSLTIAEDLLMEVWGMAVIAKACLHPQPLKRPLIIHVLLALQNPVKVVARGDSMNKMELVGQILDPSLIIDEDLLMEIWAMAVIAKACLDSQPSEQPQMTYALIPSLQNSDEPQEDSISASLATSDGPIPANNKTEQSKIVDTLHKGKPSQVPVSGKDILEQSKIGASNLGSTELEIACEDFTNVIGSTAVDTLQKGKLSETPVHAEDISEQSKIGAPKLRRAHLEAASEDLTSVIGSMAVSTLDNGKLSNGSVLVKDEKEQSEIGASKLGRTELKIACEDLGSTTVGTLHNGNFFKGPVHTKDIEKQFKIGVKMFQRAQLKLACEDFSSVIWSTAAGTLYNGKLSNGVKIAILSLSMASSSMDWSRKLERQFREKIATLSKVNHKNFVNILGYCDEEEPFTRMLVFEHVHNGSLFEHLQHRSLDWAKRMRIIMGMAYCLEHMHRLTPPIAHKNLNSSQVYLTEDYAAKISDFGLLDEVATADMNSILESNVYSFGVLLFEIITGFPYKERSNSLNWPLDDVLRGRPIEEIVDPTLGSFDAHQLEGIVTIIKSCISSIPSRKTHVMGEITTRLRKVTGIGSHVSAPKLSPDLRAHQLEGIGKIIRSCVTSIPNRKTQVMGEITARLRKVTGIRSHVSAPKLLPPLRQQCSDEKSLGSQSNNTGISMKQSSGHAATRNVRPSAQQQTHIQTTKREESLGFPNILMFFFIVYTLYIFFYILPPQSIKDSVRGYAIRQIRKCFKRFLIKLKPELFLLNM